MKKGNTYTVSIERLDYPNKGVAFVDGYKVTVKNTLPGQEVMIRINKKRRDRVEGRILEVVTPSPDETMPTCSVFGKCGGCLTQSLPYEKQLVLKERQVKALLAPFNIEDKWLPIVGSPEVYGYRNKMEYTFGDTHKDGPLALGLHQRGSMYDIVNTTDCRLVHNDYNLLVQAILNYFTSTQDSFYHKVTHKGYLRHLVIRHGKVHQQLLINLVTSSQGTLEGDIFVDMLRALPLENTIKGIIHTTNDNLADVVQEDHMACLYGEPQIEESLLGLKFNISPFSFFQTNTYGAEKLYQVVRDFVGDTKDQVVFDLYSGTGTIAQLVAPVAKKAVGVEIVAEAVEAAKVNAAYNGLTNCEFIAGDVLKVIDTLEAQPDIIILDPPRDGIHPKALPKIIDYGVKRMVYVSCKPTSLARDLKILIAAGYEVERIQCVDMFGHTPHVETIVSLQKQSM